jgi:hypothetical protein
VHDQTGRDAFDALRGEIERVRQQFELAESKISATVFTELRGMKARIVVVANRAREHDARQGAGADDRPYPEGCTRIRGRGRVNNRKFSRPQCFAQVTIATISEKSERAANTELDDRPGVQVSGGEYVALRKARMQEK